MRVTRAPWSPSNIAAIGPDTPHDRSRTDRPSRTPAIRGSRPAWRCRAGSARGPRPTHPGTAPRPAPRVRPAGDRMRIVGAPHDVAGAETVADALRAERVGFVDEGQED